MIDLSVIVVNWNTKVLLAECLDSILQTTDHLRTEVIVFDNGSSDGSQAMLREQFPDVCLIAHPDNLGFARANNRAMADSSGRYMLLFNSDAIAMPGSIEALVALADAEPRAGIVGARLLNTDGSFQASYTPFPNLWREFLVLSGLGRLLFGAWYPSRGPEEGKGPQVVDYVEGACMLVRREAFDQVGGMDEGYFMYAEEVDWCYAMKQAGWQVWYQPDAPVIHHGGGSSRHRWTRREADLYGSRVRFFRKHYGDGAATALKALIYVLTALKIGVHGALRLISGSRLGRPVVGLGDLLSSLRNA